MRNKQVNSLIVSSLLLACMFMLMPLPDWATRARPDIITLVLMYWWLAHPEKIGIYTGFLMGLVLDVMYGSLLGQHAIGMVLIAWVFVKNYQRIRVLPLLQQGIFITLALFLKQFIAFWVDNARHYDTGNFLIYFLPCVLGGLLWPWLFILMRDLRRKVSKV